jgi:transcriptional regulator with XRE-family HTH domain
MKAQALVARNLRRIRVRQNLSQESLAVDAGIDRTYVSRIERGLENPTVAILDQLARAMNADIAEFFAVPAKNEPPPQPLPGGRRSIAKRSRAKF